jgi:hypothetical protein
MSMSDLGWSLMSRRESRRGRPVTAWVERLEQRSLLTLQVSPITTVAGQYFDQAIATFAAGDVQGTLSQFSATIYWTSAVNFVTTGTIAPNGTGSFLIYASNVYATPGSFPVNVVVTGANNTSAQATGTATVTDAPLTPSPTTISTLIQTPFAGTVGSFQTTNPYATSANFTASINWGDGTAPTSGTVSSSFYDSFNVVGQHSYATVGTFPITITVTSPGGQTTIINSTAVTTALPISVFPVVVTGDAGQPIVGATVATFLNPYTTDTANAFRAVITWGDGNTTVGTVTDQGGGVFSVTGDHTYLAAGSYTTQIQVIRIANGQTASAIGTAQIGSPSPTFAFTGGLAAVPSNGSSFSSAHATTRRPTFDGTAAAFAIVQIFATPLNNAEVQMPLGETVADSSGHWRLLVTPRMTVGDYLITAVVTPPAGYPSAMMSLTQNAGIFLIGLPPGRRRGHPRTAVEAEAQTGPSKDRRVADVRTSRTAQSHQLAIREMRFVTDRSKPTPR